MSLNHTFKHWLNHAFNVLLNRTLDFIEGDYLLCPRCLARLTFREEPTADETCPICGFLIPFSYLKDSSQATPVFLQLFGLTSSGKTTFLDMLRLYLYDLNPVWPDFFTEDLTQLDADHRVTLRMERKNGERPGSTPKRERNQNEAYMMSLKKMPRWGSRELVLMDHAGEQFETFYIDTKEIPFLEKTPVTIVLFNLPDLDKGKQVDDLINSYTVSLRRNGARLAREERQLILVFNKADLIPNLPKELRDYLSADTLYSTLDKPGKKSPMTAEDIEKYLDKMREMHKIIEKWVEQDVRGGINMLNTLKKEGVPYRFTVMSATGPQHVSPNPGGPANPSSLSMSSTGLLLPNTGQTSQSSPVINPTGPLPSNPGGSASRSLPVVNSTGPLPFLPKPQRVLDPFFWVLEYYRRRGHHDIVPTSLQALRDTFSPVLRSRWNLALLGLLLAGMIGETISLAHLSSNPSITTIFSLVLVLLFLSELVKQRLTKASSTARNILRLSQLLIFGALLAIQTLPPVQQVLANLRLYQVLVDILVGAALFTCFQPEECQGTSGRVALVILAGMGALLQAYYGMDTILPAFGRFLAPDQMSGPHQIAVVTLAICTLLALWNWWSKKFFWMDQIILSVVAVYYGLLQWALGGSELAYFFPGLHLSTFNEIFLNFNGAIVCGLVIPFIQIPLRKYPRLKRLPLFVLSFIGAGMVYYLGSGIATPIGDASQAIYPLALTSTVAELLQPERLLTYSLLVGSLVLIFRLLRAPKLFTFLDHALLFFTALVCIQIQLFSWGNVPAALIPTIPFIGTHSIAFLLLFLFGLGGFMASLFLLFSLINQFSPLKQIRKRFFTPEQQEQGRETLQILGRAIERLLFCLLTLACMFQLLLYGQTVAGGDAQFIPYLGPVPRTDTIIEASLCLIAVIAHLIFLKLPSGEKKLLKRPFDRFERFLLCVPLISCTLLYVQLSQTTFQVPLAFVLTNWQLAAMQSPGTPFKFFMFCLMLLPLISLWWGTRGHFGGDRRLLQLIFGLGTIFGFFLGLTQILFLAILTILTLIAGMVVATLTLPDNT